MGKTRPVHEIRLGRIKAAIWAIEIEGRIRYSVTLTRVFKDGDQWKTCESFFREDLPLASKVIDMAHTWIYHQNQNAD